MKKTIHIFTIKKAFLATGLVCLLAVLATVMQPADVAAQTPAPPPDLPMKPQQLPIDGGLTLLAAAGGGYAIKKLRDKKHKNP